MADLIDQYTEHEAKIISRFLDQFKNADDLKALAQSYAEQIQDLEDATFEVILERVLDNAVGVQLTAIGNIVQQPRTTAVDADFKTAIRARIAINLSHGSAEDIIRVAVLILTGDEEFEVRDEPPQQFRVTILEPITIDPYLAHELLEAADVGGCRLLFNWIKHARADGFVFADSVGGTVVGGGFADSLGGATASGELASVAE